MSTVQRWQWLRNGPVWSGGNAVAMRLSVLVVLIPWAYLEFGGKKNG